MNAGKINCLIKIMKKFDIVKIVKLTDNMQKLNLQLGFHGIVLNSIFDCCEVIFYNDYNLGQSTICKVENTSIQKEDEIFPNIVRTELETYLASKYKQYYNAVLSIPTFKECDYVELIVDKPKYSKQGVRCGEKGFIVIDQVINNEILVDFTGVDQNGNLYGSEINVNTNDLKLIKKSEPSK